MKRIDVEALKISGGPVFRLCRPRWRQKGMFVKGPLPWYWLVAAARLPGQCLDVGLVLFLLHGLKRGNELVLGRRFLLEMGISRYASYRALGRLEEAGLVSVRRQRGRSPRVTLILDRGAEGSP